MKNWKIILLDNKSFFKMLLSYKLIEENIVFNLVSDPVS